MNPKNKALKAIACCLVLMGCLIQSSCASDDSNPEYPKTVNIKFEVTTTRNSEAIITLTLNNQTETVVVESLPFSNTYAQTSVDAGTFLKLTYLENGIYVSGTGGVNSWTDYSAQLTITVGSEVVKSQSFEVTENTGILQIDYTFQ
ncbi:MAG TPA: hypothetical protein PLP62_13055 [Flavobacteriaceae bacterium]|nr:hypothetical protein [Flavobacteriaceae bacterium]HPF12379.1 hypothetical protein [Flavobacteriaceae bacterium]HQU66245.1 hypothetical protein [Flavobacteriaceae bacterium]HRW45802.1 hypothetical protein [Flavobacteriaceae bacterium]